MNLVKYFKDCEKEDKDCLVHEGQNNQTYIHVKMLDQAGYIESDRFVKAGKDLQCSEDSDIDALMWDECTPYEEVKESSKVFKSTMNEMLEKMTDLVELMPNKDNTSEELQKLCLIDALKNLDRCVTGTEDSDFDGNIQ